MSEWNDSSGYHEIRLEHRQILFVFLIAAGIGVVLFLLGVIVGRRSVAESSPAGGGEVVEKVEAESPKPVDKSPDSTFFDKQSKPPEVSRPAPMPSTPPPQPKAQPQPSASVQTPPPEAPKKEPKKPGKVFSVQSGAFSTEENAKRSAAQLEKAGYEISIVPPGDNDKKKLYRVLVGEFATKEEAVAAKKRLEGMGFKNLVLK